MKNVLKIAVMTSCLISFCHGNICAAEDSIMKQQQDISTRVSRMSEHNWQAYTGAQETPRKQKHSNQEQNRKGAKQENNGQALKAEEQKPFALYFLSKKIEGGFKNIMHYGNNPQHSKLTRLIEDIMQEPWTLKGEGKPEILKGRYKGIEGCYSRRIDHGNRLVYKVP